MKTKIMTDVKLEADVPRGVIYHWMTPEQQDKALRDWVRDFHDFIRDHRSQDPVSLSVVPTFTDVCSHCKNEWEEDENGVPQCCDKAQEEYEKDRAVLQHLTTQSVAPQVPPATTQIAG